MLNPQVKGSVSQTAVTSDTSCKYKSPWLPALILAWLPIQGFPQASFRFDKLLERFTELKKAPSFYSQLIIKDTTQEQANGAGYGVGEFPCPLGITLPQL